MPNPEPRQTRQRQIIQAYLNDLARFQTAQQVHDHLRAQGAAVSLPTVYRTLAAMADAGELDVLTTDGQSAYRHCSRCHHHHLVCRQCGCTVEVAGEAVEQWAAAVGQEYGFANIAHLTEITGLCPACQTE